MTRQFLQLASERMNLRIIKWKCKELRHYNKGAFGKMTSEKYLTGLNFSGHCAYFVAIS